MTRETCGFSQIVTNPFEFLRCGALRFLVDRRIKIIAVEDEADRDDVWLAAGIAGGQMGDAGGADRGVRRFGQRMRMEDRG